MAITGWIEITYLVTDPVINGARIGTEETVILHARGATLQHESITHEQRSGTLSESTHISTIGYVDLQVPLIRPGEGLDADGASRADNVQEMLLSALRKSILRLTPIGTEYLYRIPGPIDVKLDGNVAGLVPDDINPRFSLTIRFRQHGLSVFGA